MWDASSGDLVCTYSGHFEEVTALGLLSGQRVVSVSIDGTLRTWSLEARALAKAVKEAEDEKAGRVEEKVEERKEGVMTAEEEAELAELLEDSE